METFLKTTAVIACMILIIPLMVWGGSGSWRYALEALKEYLLVMAVLVVPPLVLTAITLLPRLYE